MPRVHSHYENLKVARNAPDEVIRAAYRALAQRHHPDVNPTPEATRIMAMLNTAWETLSDPKRRAEHDAWLEMEEAAAEARAAAGQNSHASPPAPPPPPAPEPPSAPPVEPPVPPAPEPLAPTLWGLGAAVLAVGILVSLLKAHDERLTAAASTMPQPAASAVLVPEADAAPSDAVSYAPSTESDEPPYRRAPTGEAWPRESGYLFGLPRQAEDGVSELALDNRDGESDLYVKLCSADAERCDGLRHIFVRRGSMFNVRAITPGRYNVRYQELTSGQVAQSPDIELGRVDLSDAGWMVMTLPLSTFSRSDWNFTPSPQELF